MFKKASREAVQLQSTTWFLINIEKMEEIPMANAAVAAIQFALETDDGLSFLRLWNEGEFDVLRKEWPDAPEAIYVGADPLYVSRSKSSAPTVYIGKSKADFEAKSE